MAHQAVYAEGYLTKWPVSRSFGRPKRRFFVLQDCSLKYFESEEAFVQDQPPLGAIVLSYHYQLNPSAEQKHAHVLESPVNSKAPKLCFAADNQEEQEMWVEAFAKALAVLKAEHDTGQTYPDGVARSDLRASTLQQYAGLHAQSPLQFEAPATTAVVSAAKAPSVQSLEQEQTVKGDDEVRPERLAWKQQSLKSQQESATAPMTRTETSTENPYSLYGDDVAFEINDEVARMERRRRPRGGDGEGGGGGGNDDDEDDDEVEIDDDDFDDSGGDIDLEVADIDLHAAIKSGRYLPSSQPGKCKKLTLAAFFRRRCKGEAKSSPKRIEAINQLWRRWTITLYAMHCARSGDVEHFRRVVAAHRTRLSLKKLYAVAIHSRQLDIVDALISEFGVDVNARLASGSPIFWFSIGLAEQASDLCMLQALVERGADLDARNTNRQNIAFWVTYSSTPPCEAVLEYLKEHEVEFGSVDKLGTTPLHWAARQGHLPTVQWLCRNGGHNHRSANWLALFDHPSISKFATQEDRSARKEWLRHKATRHVDALTPLGVAIFHRQEFVAKYLMGYKCPTACAYKYDLFTDDNKDLKLVAATWPALLPDVLDGFVQLTNKDKFGYSGLVYDIRHLFGTPDTAANQTPLSILWATGRPEIFRHKVIKLIVNLKWSLYGRDEYVRQVVGYSILLLAFVIGFIFRPSWGLAFRCLSWVMCCYLLVREEYKELVSAPSVRAYLGVGWNWLSLLSYGLILGCIAFDTFAVSGHDEVYRLMVAPAALCLFVRCTEHMAVLRSTGPYVAMIRIMMQVTSRWAILFAWLELTMAITIFVLLRGEEQYDTFGKCLIAAFQMSLGEVDRDFSADPNTNAVATVIVLFFVLLIFVLYLNILVAMLNHSYTDLAQEAESAALLSRTEALLRMESTMKDSDRRAMCVVVHPQKGVRNYVNLRDNLFGAGTEIFISDTQVVVIEVQEEQATEDAQEQIDSLMRLQSRLEDLELLQSSVEESAPGLEVQYITLTQRIQQLQASLDRAELELVQSERPQGRTQLATAIPRHTAAVSKGIKKTLASVFKLSGKDGAQHADAGLSTGRPLVHKSTSQSTAASTPDESPLSPSSNTNRDAAEEAKQEEAAVAPRGKVARAVARKPVLAARMNQLG